MRLTYLFLKKILIGTVSHILIFVFCENLTAQVFDVTDKKGTIVNVINNVVTVSAAEPINPNEGDVWFDTNSPPTLKIYDATTNIWEVLEVISQIGIATSNELIGEPNNATNLVRVGDDGGAYINAIETIADKIVFSAEYSGGALDEGAGTDHIVDITSKSTDAPDFMNYYEVSNALTDGGTNDYGLILRFTLPGDFDSWSTTSDAIVIDFEGTTDTSFEADVYEEGSLLHDNIAVAGTGLTGFSENTIAVAADLVGLDAGDTGIIAITMTVSDVGTLNTSIIRLGDITLNYNRKRF